jgi:hypothetical protein
VPRIGKLLTNPPLSVPSTRLIAWRREYLRIISPAEPTLKITKPTDNTNIKKKDIDKSSVQLSFDF